MLTLIKLLNLNKDLYNKFSAPLNHSIIYKNPKPNQPISPVWQGPQL